METIWLTKLILAHLLTDFFLQRKTWIDERGQKHFASAYLYLHTGLTALIAWMFIGWEYWLVALVIFVTHTLIDGWKSYRSNQAKYFLIDQLLHLLVILLCWWATFFSYSELKDTWQELFSDRYLLIYLTAFVFVTTPCSFLIGQLTSFWRNKLAKADDLAYAGRWIGIIERMIILSFVLLGQFEAIGLLVAAKSIIRFTDNERSEQKTEYLLIGTMISFSLAILAGLIVSAIT